MKIKWTKAPDPESRGWFDRMPLWPMVVMAVVAMVMAVIGLLTGR